MIKIIICDDDKLYREELKKLISHILFDKEDVVFECYGDGQELVNAEAGTNADLIFMDITMPGIDGMETARILRKKKVDADIIFVTQREDMVYQGYEVRAFAYLLKNQVEKKLKDTIERYLNEYEKGKKYLFLKCAKSKKRIALNRVRYLVSDKRKIRVVLENPSESETFYMKMSEIENKLKTSGFIRCHQSYLVNRDYIGGKEGSALILTGGEKIPLSRRYRREVIESMKEMEGALNGKRFV